MIRMSQLFHTDLSVFNLCLRAVVVYLSVLILLRLSGKRQMGQMGATEFVAVLLISNAVQNSMNGGDNSLAAGVILAVVLIALSSLISYLTFRSKVMAKVFEGTPTLLVNHGKLLRPALDREKISEAELRTMLRKQGIHHIHHLETAILEADGSLSIVKANDPLQHHP